VLPNSQIFARIHMKKCEFTIFKLFHEIYFLTAWTANNAKNSLSLAFSQKSFYFFYKRRKHGWFWVRKIFCEKTHERLFLALFAKKIFREKVWKFVIYHLNSQRISVRICEFCSPVTCVNKKGFFNWNKDFAENLPSNV
jgi:hypothetical protein